LASLPPEDAPSSTLVGTHPFDATYKFLSSVRIGGSNIKGFRKVGSYVFLNFGHVITTLVGLAPSAVFQAVDLSGGDLPDTWVTQVRIILQIGVDTGVVAVGDRCNIKIRGSGFSDDVEYWGIRPANSNRVQFIIEAPINFSFGFEILMDGQFDTIEEAFLVGYAEGRNTAALEMGA
jgi:hypothetical protein